jgi:hypothetical protein
MKMHDYVIFHEKILVKRDLLVSIIVFSPQSIKSNQSSSIKQILFRRLEIYAESLNYRYLAPVVSEKK